MRLRTGIKGHLPLPRPCLQGSPNTSSQAPNNLPPHTGPRTRISAAQTHPRVKIALEAVVRVRWGTTPKGAAPALHWEQGEGMAALGAEQKGEGETGKAHKDEMNKRGKSGGKGSRTVRAGRPYKEEDRGEAAKGRGAETWSREGELQRQWVRKPGRNSEGRRLRF